MVQIVIRLHIVVAMIMATAIRQLIVTRRRVMCRLSDTWRLRRLSEASTPLPFMAVEPPENTLFSFKKEIRRGEIKNNSKGFSGGASGRYTPAGVGAEL